MWIFLFTFTTTHRLFHHLLNGTKFNGHCRIWSKKNPISFILEIFNLGGHTVNEHIFVLNEQKVNRLVLILRLSPSVLFKICSLCFVGCVQRYATGQSDSFFIRAMIIHSRLNIWNCSYYTYYLIFSQFCCPIGRII